MQIQWLMTEHTQFLDDLTLSKRHTVPGEQIDRHWHP
jgi:hypothetical protein